MSTIDTRKQAIIHWLTDTIKLEIIHFEPASSDASFRRYFRVTHQKGQHIVMDAPPEKENTEPFIRIAALLTKHSVNIPDIVQQDIKQGFLLLEDFGSQCFLDLLSDSTADKFYSSAFDSLFQMQNSINTDTCQLPLYDKALLDSELVLFYQWFLLQTLNLSIPENLKISLNQLLISSALEQPQVCVHRDYHSRNLMVLKHNSPGIIDFQDAVIGPITYDLVSLLRDCYIAWPEHKIEQWITQYFQHITELGLINTSLESFTRWFDLMGVQRHLKAIGIFSRLYLRDNKPGYLQDIPRTLNYVSQICHKYPELAEFNHYLNQQVLPVYQKKCLKNP